MMTLWRIGNDHTNQRAGSAEAPPCVGDQVMTSTHDNLDPPEKCCVDTCNYNQYKQGYCLEHYIENEESKADYLYDMRRDREYERESNEPR